MYNLNFRKYILLICSAFLLTICSAQENAQELYQDSDIEHRQFDKEKWGKVIDGIDYNEKEKRPKEKDKSDSWEGFGGNPSSFFGNLSGIRYLFYAIGIIILGVLVFFIVKNTMLLHGTANRKNRAFTIEEAEQNLLETDLQRFLKEALAKGDYRMAVRVYYLEILKQLSLKGTIKWKRDKTNSEYLNEMRPQSDFKDFRKLTRTFERVWYGNKLIEKSIYNTISPQFEGYLKKIQS